MADKPTGSSTDTFVVVILGAVAILVAVAFGLSLERCARYCKRRCPNCRTYMTCLEEACADVYLNAGQRFRKYLYSVDYDVWKCPNCDEIQVYERCCPLCGYGPLSRLDKDFEDIYLDPGQRLEKALNSADYDVWKCLNCGMYTVQRYERQSSSLERCPQCGYRTVRVSSRTVVEPTYTSTGKKQTTRDCRHCKYRKRRIETLPKLTPQNTYGGSYSTYGSSSFGGGRSSGNGASGTW